VRTLHSSFRPATGLKEKKKEKWLLCPDQTPLLIYGKKDRQKGGTQTTAEIAPDEKERKKKKLRSWGPTVRRSPKARGEMES